MGVKVGILGELIRAAGMPYGGERCKPGRLAFYAAACGASEAAVNALLLRAPRRPAKVSACDMLRDWAQRFGVTIPEE